jgi:hypothetical protein
MGSAGDAYGAGTRSSDPCGPTHYRPPPQPKSTCLNPCAPIVTVTVTAKYGQISVRATGRGADRISWRRHEITFRSANFVAKLPRNFAPGYGSASKGVRASRRRISSVRLNSAFAGGQVLSSQRVDRMPRFNNASRGQGSRNGNTRRYYPTLAVDRNLGIAWWTRYRGPLWRLAMNDERCVCGHVEVDHENGRFKCTACPDETTPCPMFVLDRGAVGRPTHAARSAAS